MLLAAECCHLGRAHTLLFPTLQAHADERIGTRLQASLHRALSDYCGSLAAVVDNATWELRPGVAWSEPVRGGDVLFEEGAWRVGSLSLATDPVS
jgi:hypothetical protein